MWDLVYVWVVTAETEKPARRGLVGESVSGTPCFRGTRVPVQSLMDFSRVKQLFGDHTVATLYEQGWDSLEDGPLLTVAQKDGSSPPR